MRLIWQAGGYEAGSGSLLAEGHVVRERNGLRLMASGPGAERLRLARQREQRADRVYLAVVTAAAVVMLLT